MQSNIKKQIEDWDFIQNLAFDILKTLTDEQLDLTVGKNMGTLGEQFRHMARVRFQYAEAVEIKKIGDVMETIDPAVAKSQSELIALWERVNKKLLDVLEKSNLENMLIDWEYWGIPSMNIHDHLNTLMDHETLHNGQLIVYLRTHEIVFPESWKAWGL